MLNSELLRQTLFDIFFDNNKEKEKFLVPVSSDWFVPTIDPKEEVGTWIGYRILSKVPYTRAYQEGRFIVKPMRVSFRLSFVGPQAEEYADMVMIWEDRLDAVQAFDKIEAQVNYNDRTLFTYPVKNSGFNDRLCWVVDLSAQTFYKTDTKEEPWFKKPKAPGGH